MIEGGHIYLRAMEPQDVDVLYVWENTVDNWTISNTNLPFSKHFLNEFIMRSSNDIVIDKQIRLMICKKSDDSSIGTLDIFEYEPIHRRAGVGILIEPDSRRQGFADEAVKIAKHYCFHQLGLHQLFCHVVSDNEKSIKLFLKNNFQITGCKKDWLLIHGKWSDVLFLQCLGQ